VGVLDVHLESGDPVAGVVWAHVQTRKCTVCGSQETEAVPISELAIGEPEVCPMECAACKSTVDKVWCQGWVSPDEEPGRGPGDREAIPPPAPGAPTGQTAAEYDVYHVVEEPGAIEWRNEVEVPTEEYYRALRQDMGQRHPKADRHLLDHLLSFEALCDVSILTGFSFGCDKAFVAVTKGELLGDVVGREGRDPNGERVAAIVGFPPLKNVQQVQQFLGCTNWLRFFMMSMYSTLCKILG